MEGDLQISHGAGFGIFLLDDCLLSEFVQRHFRRESSDTSHIKLGQCKVIIVPIRE